MARRPTIKDIARRAGVSESAVSFALNDRPGVSQDTRARIRRVAEELGWQPNSAARALSGERSGAVGLVLARPAHTLGVESFFLQLVSGIQEVLSAGRIALLFQVVEDLEAECAVYRRWWAERRVDGVLVVDPRTQDPRPALLEQLALPAVLIGGTGVPGVTGATGGTGGTAATGETGLPGGTDGAGGVAGPGGAAAPGGAASPGISAVWADDALAMAQVLAHLHSLGHRRITHIAGLPGLAHTARRMASLRSEAARLGLGPGQVRSVVTDYSDAEGAAATRRVLAEAEPPTALVYDNDVMAVAGIAVATELAIPVPDRLSIVAWDDSALCRVTHPRLTALVRDTAGFGRLAAEELLAVLAGGPPQVRKGEQPRLEPRESTAPPTAAY
ncbi:MULTISPECIES: LacI family DNA-binding transcriptional regulator [unclassified Streptomyces]|uniref:LacI family DNA-binding transcriptional regulator n=1 Tax=unclassified Streptomyces TaxID=2593676 RepID=UPI001BEBB8AD|nr:MULTISPECIES: LacI family DNA-binding transcriptional regulator [unclassified Streptomyces]MBT2404292.1 LacI family DNA-binding transcriptional regulator [Streptomyces sp. ISL-21]MBT2458618.1 LacI family DNA-binding transcriptional regulator [Streptomyces sp. ISL-86]MBT2611979.1 LacI family DNA-binding transcriptional regulator [Streptomyces sp. ISL-87]